MRSLPLWLLGACDSGPTWAQVEEQNTIEGYEAFLAAGPDAFLLPTIEKRLEPLYFDRASKDDSASAWDVYHKRFPEGGANGPLANKKRTEAHFREAVAADTVDRWTQFAADFPKSGWLGTRATGRAECLTYGRLTLGEAAVAPVNMAENPKGPMDGKGVTVPVTNGGDVALEHVGITLWYLSDDGAELSVQDYPLTSPTWQLPATDLQKKPLAAGETRPWFWSIGDEYAPKGWNGRVRVWCTGARPVTAQ
jgi:hypothetical protein